jgi:chromosome partitioning protein
MRTIAFVTQKGGAGKSTLASSIAVAARCAGERAFIVDLDPTQCLVKWSKARRASDVPVEHAPPDKLSKILIELKERGISLVVIDAPGADLDGLEEVIRAADLCIIPVRPNIFDIWAGEATRVIVKHRTKDCVFLLNQCPPAQQTTRVQRSAKALEETGALLAPLVSARVDYQEAARLGLGVNELNPHGAAAREMRELWESIERRLGKRENEVVPLVESEDCAEAQAEAAAPGLAAELPAPPPGVPALRRQSSPNWPFFFAPFWPFWPG